MKLVPELDTITLPDGWKVGPISLLNSLGRPSDQDGYASQIFSGDKPMLWDTFDPLISDQHILAMSKDCTGGEGVIALILINPENGEYCDDMQVVSPQGTEEIMWKWKEFDNDDVDDPPFLLILTSQLHTEAQHSEIFVYSEYTRLGFLFSWVPGFGVVMCDVTKTSEEHGT